MNVLSLFAGIGGLELGLERAGMTVVGQVELDPFCRRVLDKHWPEVPKHDDVRTAVEWWESESRPAVHVVAGGFPCQGHSFAGRRRGVADPRWGWPWMFDVVRVLRPDYVLVENVAALIADREAFSWVLGDLASVGYDAEWDCVPAAAVGAPHRRDRVFVVAYPNGVEHEGGTPAQWRQAAPVLPVAVAAGERRGARRARRSAGDGAHGQGLSPQELAHADRTRLEGPRVFRAAPQRGGDWATEPDVGRVANGVPCRVDRLRGLGNAVVPQVAEHIGRLIVAADRELVA